VRRVILILGWVSSRSDYERWAVAVKFKVGGRIAFLGIARLPPPIWVRT
jgi:hypothetical protein